MEDAKKDAGKAPVSAAPQSPPKAAPAQQPPQKTAKDAAAPGKAANASPPPTAAPARWKRRHTALMLGFALWVLVPMMLAASYLYLVAKDQYASHIGFSVRSEEVGSAIELLGGITELSGSSSSDTDILYEFIQSPKLVRAVNEKLDLQRIYTRDYDPIFSIGDDVRIEALVHYWQRMVKVFYDSSSGLIEIRVLAFEPKDATAIAETIFAESSRMINDLSAIARADATRYARDELDRALERVKLARQAKITFQSRTQIVDPLADIQGRIGLLNSLHAQLVEVSIERELLLESARPNDPRLVQIESTIEAIRKLIQEERNQFGGQNLPDGQTDDKAYADLLGEFEVLEVEQEFAEKAYLSARATYDAAIAEAQRKSRYLASYLGPTLAETPEYPRKFTILLTLAVLLSVSWAILVMVYYSLRDRR